MYIPTRPEPHVFSVDEIARAAGVPAEGVRALIDAGDVGSVQNRFVSLDEAIRLVQSLGAPGDGRAGGRRLFAPAPRAVRPAGMPLAASGALHAAVVALVLLATSLGAGSAPAELPVHEPARLVFLATPGPGGGGGGGGLRQPAPPPRARLRGTSALRSPVTVARSVETTRETRAEPPPRALPEARPDPQPPALEPAMTPPVVAPVVSAPDDPEDSAGVLTETAAALPSHGPGFGGGTGTGRSGGSGEGDGTGIGAGSMAGTGGGPYRPGSGVAPPALRREVKPIYTEDGRRRGVEGDVLMEVIVRADGRVGTVRIVRGIGAGLDQRAAEAVRQWEFSPATRFGRPVDVLVEVAVEFRLR